jgi:hypothetical protein
MSDSTPPTPTPHAPHRLRLPDTRRSITHKGSIGGRDVYIIVGFFDGVGTTTAQAITPGEVFIKIAKQGDIIHGLIDGLALTISLALQYGVPWPVLRDKYRHTRFGTADPYTSLLDGLAVLIDEAIASQTSIVGDHGEAVEFVNAPAPLAFKRSDPTPGSERLAEIVRKNTEQQAEAEAQDRERILLASVPPMPSSFPVRFNNVQVDRILRSATQPRFFVWTREGGGKYLNWSGPGVQPPKLWWAEDALKGHFTWEEAWLLIKHKKLPPTDEGMTDAPVPAPKPPRILDLAAAVQIVSAAVVVVEENKAAAANAGPVMNAGSAIKQPPPALEVWMPAKDVLPGSTINRQGYPRLLLTMTNRQRDTTGLNGGCFMAHLCTDATGATYELHPDCPCKVVSLPDGTAHHTRPVEGTASPVE